MMINVAFLGAGDIAGLHAEALAAVAGARLAAVADIDLDRARGLAGRYGAAALSDLDALLRFPGLDVIYILTPPAGHAQQIIAAATAGLPIVCEKPLTISLDEADRAIAACRQAGVPLMTGLSHRYHPLAARARELLHSGDLGDFVAAWSHRLIHLPVSPDSWLNDPAQGGGLTLQYAMHDLDWLCWLGGPVAQVAAQEAHSNPGLAIEDNLWALVRFRNGGSGTVGASWSVPASRVERGLVGSQGNLRIVEQKRLVGRLAGGRDLREDLGQDYDWLDVFVRESRDIISCVQQGRPFSVTGEDGRQALEISLAAQLAARSGRLVSLPLASQAPLEVIH
jgi:myo-inositol 2-dehydrogenase/D-chiro-inositol 1-dehydrogenase